jgi:hypothetical protein
MNRIIGGYVFLDGTLLKITTHLCLGSRVQFRRLRNGAVQSEEKSTERPTTTLNAGKPDRVRISSAPRATLYGADGVFLNWRR